MRTLRIALAGVIGAAFVAFTLCTWCLVLEETEPALSKLWHWATA